MLWGAIYHLLSGKIIKWGKGATNYYVLTKQHGVMCDPCVRVTRRQ